MQVFLVGGAVRDQLLGLPIGDKDFVVVGADKQALLSLGFEQVGADFPVFLHPKTHCEYALARQERKSGQGYLGFSTSTQGVSLQEDLLRRDLTINALALEVVGLEDDTPITGEIIDYYNGLEDLKQRRLRHISSAFTEDPLRILRTLRFFARYQHLGFLIADETLLLIQAMAEDGQLDHLSRERLWTESAKAMSEGVGAVYWHALYHYKILPFFLPALNEHWRTKKVFLGAIKSLNLAKNSAVAIQFALLCADDVVANKDQAKERIFLISKALKAPKYPIWLANCLIEYAQLFLTQPSAMDILRFIEISKAHQGDNTALMDVLSVLFYYYQGFDLVPVMTHKKAQVLLNESLTAYRSVGINDIQGNLKGAQIGQALAVLREKAILKCLDI